MTYLKRAILFLFVISACAELTEKARSLSNSSNQLVSSIAFDQTIEDDDCLESSCTYIEVSYPEINQQNKPSQFIEKAIKKQLRDYIRDAPSTATVEQLMMAFMDDYHEFTDAFPESEAPWYLSIQSKINLANNELISFEISTDSYTGGAHSNKIVQYFNIDLNGQNVPPLKIIKDRQQFTAIAEDWFRAQKSLSETDDLNEAGYWFEGNSFQLPENIGFSEAGVLLYYNDYEIGPHATGSSRIAIPYAKVQELLSITPQS